MNKADSFNLWTLPSQANRSTKNLFFYLTYYC